MRNGIKGMRIWCLALVCAACSMNSEPPESGGGAATTGLVAVRFASDALVPARSRAAGPARIAGDQWDGGEAIGIYMIKHNVMPVDAIAENINYTTASSGTGPAVFTATTPLYYPIDGSAVDFVAYHPHQGTLSNWIYQVNVGTQTNQSAIDLMWSDVVDNSSNGNSGYTKNDAATTVTLPFAHKLAKLKLVVTAGAGVDDLSGMTVTIKGMKTTAEFDVSTGGALSNEGGPADIRPLKDEHSYTYEAILLPVTLGAAHTVEFLVGGTTYTWKLENRGSWAAGTINSYEVEVTKYPVVISGTITDWGTGSGSTTENAD